MTNWHVHIVHNGTFSDLLVVSVFHIFPASLLIFPQDKSQSRMLPFVLMGMKDMKTFLLGFTQLAPLLTRRNWRGYSSHCGWLGGIQILRKQGNPKSNSETHPVSNGWVLKYSMAASLLLLPKQPAKANMATRDNSENCLTDFRTFPALLQVSAAALKTTCSICLGLSL